MASTAAERVASSPFRSPKRPKRAAPASSERAANLLRMFEVEFFVDGSGRSACRQWCDGLVDYKLQTFLGAVQGVLSQQGIGVCGTPYGKHLGQGLAEFRIRRDSDRGPVLLRVFFHAHGDHKILLLSGYDKGADPTERRQQKEIRRARGLLREFRDS